MNETALADVQPCGSAATATTTLFGPVGRWSLEPVAVWLLTAGRRIVNPRQFLDALVAQLDAAGARIDRMRISSPTLHPQLAALGISWIRGEDAQLWSGMHGVMQSDAYIGSPMEFVRNSQQTLHQTIPTEAAAGEHPVWQDLRAEGMRDYLGDTHDPVRWPTEHPDHRHPRRGGIRRRRHRAFPGPGQSTDPAGRVDGGAAYDARSSRYLRRQAHQRTHPARPGQAR